MPSQVPFKKGSSANLGITLYSTGFGLITNPSSVAAQISKDFGAFNAVPSSDLTVVSTVYGLIKLALESTHTDADVVSLFVDDDTAGCVPWTATIYTADATLNMLSTAVAAVSTQVSAVSSAVSSVASNVTGISTVVSAYSGVIERGTGVGSGAASFTFASTSAWTSDSINGATLLIAGDTGYGQARTVLAFDSTTKIATVDSWTVTPATNAPYTLFATPPASLSEPMPANVLEWNSTAVASDHPVVAANLVTFASTASTGFLAALSTQVSAVSSAVSSVASAVSLVSTQASALSSAVSSAATAIGLVSTQVSAVSSQVSSVAASTSVAEAVLDGIIESTLSLRQVTRGMGAVLLGLASGSSGSTTVFRDLANTKNRITAITDTSGNRATVTIDWS